MHASTEGPQLLHGIDMSAPDAPKQLLDFHRLTFGDAVMRVNADADDQQEDDTENSDADDQQDDDTDASDADDTDDTDAQELGDKGKRALDSMKAKVKAATTARKAAEAEAARLKAEKDNAGKPAEEQALNAARLEGATAATAAANKRIIRSEVKAAAAGKLKNPALAVKLIDLDSLEVDEDGEVDEEAIAEAISALLEENPYLAAQGGDTKFDSARGKPKQKPKLTKADLDKMTPEQVAKAYDEGRVQA
jgi:hypothetical protein